MTLFSILSFPQCAHFPLRRDSITFLFSKKICILWSGIVADDAYFRIIQNEMGKYCTKSWYTV